MVDTIVAGFLIAHGLVHAAIWTVPPGGDEPPPFVPARSWALQAAAVPDGTARTASIALALTSAALLVVAGVALLAGAEAWPAAALAGVAVAAAFKAVWFDPWLTVGIVLDVAVAVAVLAGWPPSLY